MFFTKAGIVIAWLLFIPSAIAYGIVLAFVWSGNAAARTHPDPSPA